MINTKLHPISHRFQVIADYWSKCAFDRGVPLFDTLDRGGNPYTQDHKIWPQETRHIALLYGVDILTEDYLVLSQFTRLTDGRTDRCRQQERGLPTRAKKCRPRNTERFPTLLLMTSFIASEL